jgi:phosphoglycerate dehydrogenase-like enzyme
MIGPAMPWLIEGTQMGIIGLGTIGGAVARRAAALGMHVVGVRRRVDQGKPVGVEDVVGPDALDDVIASSDVLVLAAPWTGATDRLIDERAIARMKRGAIVINIARGQLVCETSLARALSEGRLCGAALDVFNDEPLPPSSPLWSAPNVIITPHTSGFRADHWDAAVDLFIEQLRRFIGGEPLLNPVDAEAGY